MCLHASIGSRRLALKRRREHGTVSSSVVAEAGLSEDAAILLRAEPVVIVKDVKRESDEQPAVVTACHRRRLLCTVDPDDLSDAETVCVLFLCCTIYTFVVCAL